MSGQRQPNWTNIEIPEDENGRNVEIELDLDSPSDEEPNRKVEANVEEKPNSRPNPRTIQKEEAEEDAEDRSQNRRNQEEKEVQRQVNNLPEEEQPVRKQRAFKRIQQLAGEKNVLISEVQRLQNELEAARRGSHRASLDQAKANKELWTNNLADKRAALEQAIEHNNAKAQAKLIEEIAEAKTNVKVYDAVERDLAGQDDEEQSQRRQVPQQRQIQNRQPDPADLPEATQKWAERNPWMRTNSVLNTAARQAAQELIDEGEDPTTDEFYNNLDKRLKDNGIVVPSGQSRQTPVNQGRRSPVGSSADNDGEDFSTPGGGSRPQSQFKRVGGKVQVTPTADDEEMAGKMGVDVKSYMREKYKYDAQGYKGYVNIDVPQ